MSVRKEVELIIEQNITKRTRLNHFDWDPCATSTPVRKPLNTINNFDPGFGYNQCDVMSRNISFKITPKKLGQNYEVNSSKKTAKKNKTKSRNSFYRDDEETDDNEHNEDCPKDTGIKKNLIIKLGSNEFDSKRIKRSGITEVVKKKVNRSSNIKGQNEVKKNMNCRPAKNKSKPKAKDSAVTKSVSCIKRKKTRSGNSSDVGNIETPKNRVSSESSTNNIVTNDKCLIPVLPEREKTIEADNIPHKRKNKIAPLDNVVSKKSKSDPELETSGLCNEDYDPVEEVKCIQNGLDNSSKGNKTKQSTSHEIFSENKERELRDSLNMTDIAATVSEELNEISKSNQSEIIKALQKKQKVIPKKKISVSQRKLKYKTIVLDNLDSTAERPRRARKSPKEFWLPRSEDDNINKASVHEVNVIDKVKDGELSSASTIQKEETSKRIITSNENGSSNSFINKDFFHDVREMQFTEVPASGNEREVYSYALGWRFPAFKCGALKIGKNCESSGRTEHKNSHFGGVLLEGKLLMKIQENEVELTSGQMFCVPPLTDWKATNIAKKDCVLYYWSGRF